MKDFSLNIIKKHRRFLRTLTYEYIRSVATKSRSSRVALETLYAEVVHLIQIKCPWKKKEAEHKKVLFSHSNSRELLENEE